MTGLKSREIHLKEYPKGAPTADLYEIKEVDVREPGEGEVLIRIVWMTVDPYMRGRMRPDVKSYIPPFQLGEPLDGGAVGQVVKSKADGFAEGDYVVGFNGGWREYYTGPAEAYTKVDPNLAPLSAYLGVLGMPGMTAWAGVTQIMEPNEGETMMVTGAAGAVGSIVCQIGKLKGCKVIGSAGSKEKCDWITSELGVDVAYNYKDFDGSSAKLSKFLAEHAPKGIDTYFENVGGFQLEALINNIGFAGRIALCGMISQYNNTTPEPGPSNLTNLIGRGVLVKGFIVSNYMNMMPQFFAEMGPWVAGGKVKFRETVYEGLDAAPEAFAGLFTGDNTGKVVIRIGPDNA
ncbi:NADP-dependent oxidoreductase [Parvularcula sp. IMCC14364]|uniref:NADP-dependent oxidoreductase n=1 Tax=Parvularcula sp. IMCC14364 TaxID=3067902 RepID=UPI00274162D9|nr:NADP-dependent oxidoreductase [Parvularcula sp. IMCC14364]